MNGSRTPLQLTLLHALEVEHRRSAALAAASVDHAASAEPLTPLKANHGSTNHVSANHVGANVVMFSGTQNFCVRIEDSKWSAPVDAKRLLQRSNFDHTTAVAPLSVKQDKGARLG